MQTAQEAAQKVRDISKISVENIAFIFGVSRVAYYDWLHGRNITLEHYVHLLAVMDTLVDVQSLFGRYTGVWLLAPCLGTKRPIDLLKEQEYKIVREQAKESYYSTFKSLLTTSSSAFL